MVVIVHPGTMAAATATLNLATTVRNGQRYSGEDKPSKEKTATPPVLLQKKNLNNLGLHKKHAFQN